MNQFRATAWSVVADSVELLFLILLPNLPPQTCQKSFPSKTRLIQIIPSKKDLLKKGGPLFICLALHANAGGIFNEIEQTCTQRRFVVLGRS